MVTEKDIKEKRKKCIKNEHFMFKLAIMIGAVRYRIEYRGDDVLAGCRWVKKYKVRAWHPYVWVMCVVGCISSIIENLFTMFSGLKNEFKEKSYYV